MQVYKTGNHKRYYNSKFAITMLLFVASLLAMIFGVLLALGAYELATILVVLFVGPALIIYPKLGLGVAIAGALVAAGLIDLYFPALRQLKWGVAILSTSLAGISMGAFFLTKSTKSLPKTETNTATFCALGFFICAVFSSLINWHGVAGVVGLKGYFQVWGLLIAIYYLAKNENDASRLIWFLWALALFQLPFVLQQFIVLVPKRTGLLAAEHGVVAVDVVAGTFGGSMNGGGRSSSLALLMTICLTLLLARWRQALVGWSRALVFSILLLLPLLLNEAKIIVVLIPVVFFMLFKDRILSNPLKALAGLVFLVLLLVSIFTAYLMLPGTQSHKKVLFEEMYQDTIDYNVGKRGYGNLALNRATVYSFWFKEHMHRASMVSILIGHGPGATNEGSTVMEDSLATKRYPRFGIGLTGLSSLLWEVGLLGTGFAIGLLFFGFSLGTKLAKRWQGTQHWALIKAAQISMPLFGINLFHNNFFIVDLSFQALFVILLGYLMVMTRFDSKPV